MRPHIGILEILNLQSDKRLYLASDDCFADTAKVRFQLDLGAFPDKALQEDYAATGLELFEIREVEALLSSEEKDAALKRWESSAPEGLLY